MSSTAESRSTESHSTEIASILNEVHSAVLESSARIGDLGLVVEEVEVSLQTAVNLKGGVELDLKVIKIGTDVSTESVSTVTTTFVPAGAVPAAEFKSDLAKALEVIEQGIAAAGNAMTLSGAAVEVSFAVTAGGGITVVLAGEAKKEETHSVKLKLATS